MRTVLQFRVVSDWPVIATKKLVDVLVGFILVPVNKLQIR